MSKIANQLNAIVGWTKQLAKNLNIKGVGASENETLNTLVPKVLSIVNSGDVTLGEKEITEDGEYYAYQDDLDGYSKVKVNVLGDNEFIGYFNGRTSSNTNPKNIKMLIDAPAYAFMDEKINEVNLTKCKNIGIYAFSNCGLQKVIGPNPLKISSGAFNKSILAEGTITISSEQTSIESYTFNESSLNVVLHDSITEIKDYAFCKNYNREWTSLPNSLQKIGIYAFDYDRSLKITKFPDDLQEIGKYAFRNATSLTNIEFSNKINTLGSHCFDGSSISKIVIHKTTPPVLNSYAFYKCPLETIEVPASSLEKYKSASNWSQYADIMAGIEGE